MAELGNAILQATWKFKQKISGYNYVEHLPPATRGIIPYRYNKIAFADNLGFPLTI